MNSDIDPHRLSRRLWTKIAVALVLVGAAAGASFGLQTYLVWQDRASATEINVSGRQRMLSQRTALFAVLASSTPPEDREPLLETHRTLVELMEKSHRGLTLGDAQMKLPGKPASPVAELYFGETKLDERVRLYLSAHRQLNASLVEVDEERAEALLAKIIQDAPGLLKDLHRTVGRYVKVAHGRVDNLRGVQVILLAVLLGLLLLEALFLFRPMVGALRRQVERIAKDQAELEAQRRSTQLVLDSTGEGLLTCNYDGSLRDVVSANVEQWFGPVRDRTVWQLLLPEEPTRQLQLQLDIEQIQEDFMPFEVTVSQMQRRIDVAPEVILEMEPRKVTDSGNEYLLFVLKDVTAQVAAAKLASENEELQELVGRILKDPKGFREFVNEQLNMLAGLAELEPRSPLVARTLHTLKGNAGLFGMGRFAHRCHELEDMLEDGPPSDTAAWATDLRHIWDGCLSQLDRFLPNNEGNEIVVERDEHQAMVEALKGFGVQESTVTVLRSWAWEPVRLRLERLADKAEALARRLGKRIEVDIETGGARLPPGYIESFWPTLVHVVRNAMDHGFEPVEQRLEAGKSEVGRLCFEVQVGSEIVVSISDDGQGIEWQRLRDKATSRGLVDVPTVDVLFVDGLSSREEVTELSGRGVGLADVKASCLRYGGKLDVVSRPGRGTRFSFRFPLPEQLPQAAA